MADTCATCRYFLLEGQGNTVCRRYPPNATWIQANIVQPAIKIPVWPNPDSGAYCGEFRPAETTGGVLRFPQRDAADENSDKGPRP